MKHVMYVLNQTGHAPVVRWDPKVNADVKTAEEAFGELKAKKFHAFDVTNPQDTKELKKFDPEAKEVVVFGQPQAG